MESVERIVRAEQLTAVFGYWPSFHDAEILWLRLDRQNQENERPGPVLEVLVHAFEMTNEVGADGGYVLRHHVLVHLRFFEVVELRLDGFNHQNALMGLRLIDLRECRMERVRWEVHCDSAFGIDASFKCYAVEVVSVVPCSKSGQPLDAGHDAAVK